MRIAVTGGGGFIGRHTVSAFAESAESVVALTGAGDCLPKWPSNVVSAEIDVRDPHSIAPHLEGVNVVLHLAGPPMVRDSFVHPIRYSDIHTGGTTNVLQAAVACGAERFVYLSSAEVYGQPLRNPVDEDHPLLARSPYGAAKIGAERMVEAFTHFTDLSAFILRPFSIYGPGQNMNSLLGTIIRQLNAGQEVELADLRPVRDYLFISDLVDALQASCIISSTGCTTLNLGSGSGTSVEHFASITAAAMGVAATVRQAASSDRPEKAGILELVSDIRRARKTLGWSPRTQLLDGLSATVTSEVQA